MQFSRNIHVYFQFDDQILLSGSDCISFACRYDGRGHLFDLRPYDADSRKGLPTPVLTEDEKNIEKLCDEERYLELHTDLAEKAMYEGKL